MFAPFKAGKTTQRDQATCLLENSCTLQRPFLTPQGQRAPPDNSRTQRPVFSLQARPGGDSVCPPTPASFSPGPYLRLGRGQEEGLPRGNMLKLNHSESRMTKATPSPMMNLGHATPAISSQKTDETLREEEQSCYIITHWRHRHPSPSAQRNE